MLKKLNEAELFINIGQLICPSSTPSVWWYVYGDRWWQRDLIERMNVEINIENFEKSFKYTLKNILKNDLKKEYFCSMTLKDLKIL